MKQDEKLRYAGEEYRLVFNFNVMEAIQEEYETVARWAQLTDREEPDAKAVIFGVTAMINEGIDMDNEENGTTRKPLTRRQVGRLLTQVGMDTAARAMQSTVLSAAGSDEKNG